jgi:hypothetical protein
MSSGYWTRRRRNCDYWTTNLRNCSYWSWTMSDSKMTN